MQSILREFSKVLTELFFRDKESSEGDICILRSFSSTVSKVLFLSRVGEDMVATGKAKGL